MFKTEGELMRAYSLALAGLLGLAATAPVMGCTPTTSAPMAQQTCAPGNPWVPAGYNGTDGKWVPGHCTGQAAQ
jgi:hypothetical protein